MRIISNRESLLHDHCTQLVVTCIKVNMERFVVIWVLNLMKSLLLCGKVLVARAALQNDWQLQLPVVLVETAGTAPLGRQ